MSDNEEEAAERPSIEYWYIASQHGETMESGIASILYETKLFVQNECCETTEAKITPTTFSVLSMPSETDLLSRTTCTGNSFNVHWIACLACQRRTFDQVSANLIDLPR
jgi:hypothetical protein